MADILRIIDRFMISGRGPIYMVKHNADSRICVGDIFYDLRGNKFAVRGIEVPRRMMLDESDIKDMPIGLLFDMIDGVEAHGSILVKENTQVNFLFCNHPLYARKVDADYEEEYNEAVKNHQCALFSYEEMEKGELSLYGEELSGLTVYRGWMMKPKMYQLFYNLLEEKGIILINSPEEYERYHTLPGWYNEFAEFTAESLWENEGSVVNILEKAAMLEGGYIVKDYVKSRKHEWYDACYIPNIRDKGKTEKVITNFVKRQGESLVGGIVLRKCENLRQIGYHEKSGMPISEEYRAFVFAGKIHTIDNYWHGDNDVQLSQEETSWLEGIATKVRSNFVTIDLARREDGMLIVMELGDGQVSGLQEIPAGIFYESFC